MKFLSILTVDDNIAARRLLKSVLMGLGRRTIIHEASSGSEAIKLIKLDLYNIIFLDIEMPGMDGFEVLEKILKEIPDQFVVMVSSNTSVNNVKKTIELGGKGFIAKPYKIEKVNDIVGKFIRTQSTPNQRGWF